MSCPGWHPRDTPIISLTRVHGSLFSAHGSLDIALGVGFLQSFAFVVDLHPTAKSDDTFRFSAIREIHLQGNERETFFGRLAAKAFPFAGV